MDKEVQERMADLIDKILVSYETMLTCQIPEKFIESRQLIMQRGSNQIIETLKELGYRKIKDKC